MDARVSFGSFGFVWFIPARPGGCRVHSGWYGCAPGVAGFIQSLLVHSGEPLGSSGSFQIRFIRVRLVHSGAPWFSFGFVWFIGAYQGGGRVQLVSFGSFGRAEGVIRARRGIRRVHSVSFGTFERARVVVGVIRVHSWAPRGSSGSFGCVRARVVVLILVRLVHYGAPLGRRVHCCSFGSLPGFIGFILFR